MEDHIKLMKVLEAHLSLIEKLYKLGWAAKLRADFSTSHISGCRSEFFGRWEQS